MGGFVTRYGIELAALVATASAAVLGLVYHLDLLREARIRRREASRFPMFAVRDQLVELVARREIGSQEPAWTMTYATVNGLLNLHQKLNRDDVFKHYVAFSIAEAAIPALRIRAQRIRNQMERARKRYPSFGKVLAEMEQAFREMVEMRSGLWHTISLRFFLWRVSLPSPFKPRLVLRVVASPQPSPVALKTKTPAAPPVRDVRESLGRCRSGDLAAFASYQSAAC